MDRIKCYETGEIFNNARQAAREMNISTSSMYQAINKTCAAKGYHFFVYHNDEQAKIVETEINNKLNQNLKKQRLVELMLTSKEEKKAQKEEMLTDLFKCWYTKEMSIEDCSIASGYSKGYLYQIFRNEKVMRGLV